MGKQFLPQARCRTKQFELNTLGPEGTDTFEQTKILANYKLIRSYILDHLSAQHRWWETN